MAAYGGERSDQACGINFWLVRPFARMASTTAQTHEFGSFDRATKDHLATDILVNLQCLQLRATDCAYFS
jgi:hypothetical protein